jgi:hypothetical protein
MNMQSRIRLANVDRRAEMRAQRAVDIARLYQQGWRPRPPWHSRMRETVEFFVWVGVALALVAVGIWS